MTPRARWRHIPALAWRESRTARRRLLLYMSSISLGVAALVAIDSFAANVTDSVREQSRALVGGDLALRSRRPLPPSIDSLLARDTSARLSAARITTFASMSVIPRTGATRLSQVRAVGAGYPFYGEIVTQPAGMWARLHEGRHALVDASLLLSLGASVGDSLSLGFTRFRILGTLVSVPGDAGIAATIGPRVYIPERYLVQTGLLVFGSRAEYEMVVRVAGDRTPREWIAANRPALDSAEVRARTAAQTEERITESLEQLTDFLGIVGLVALLLGGIGVASGVHAFVTKKIDTVAVLRCLGATSGQVLTIYLLQAAAMGLVGAAAGALIGIALQFGVPTLIADFLPVQVSPSFAPGAVVLGFVVGLWVALVFALRPLIALRNVSPLQALRRETEGATMRAERRDWARHAVGATILGGVLLIAVTRARSPLEGLAMFAAIAFVVAALAFSAALLSRGARRAIGARWPFVVRQGVANLYRPANQTRAVVLAIGFGVFLIATLYQVQSSLLRRLSISTEASRANIVFFDIQDDQVERIESSVREAGQIVQTVPIVPMRIEAINGRPVEELLADTITGRRSRWSLRREYRSTYRDTLVSSEVLVEGRWLDPRAGARAGEEGESDAHIAEVSFEQDVAGELGVAVGDTVLWNVQGALVPTEVTSFRTVEWARFEPNFFAVLSPRALRDAPKQFVILADIRNDTTLALLQRDLVVQFPNVSSLDLTTIQRTIGSILDRVSTAVRFFAVFCVALAVPVLFSAVAATRRERLREGVLLKTLGATRAQIGRIMLAEYVLLGTLGGLTGVALSMASAWALARFTFEVPFVPALLPAIVLVLVMIVLSVAIGVLTGRDVFRRTPMAALREA